jgi:hypothetical protein
MRRRLAEPARDWQIPGILVVYWETAAEQLHFTADATSAFHTPVAAVSRT